MASRYFGIERGAQKTGITQGSSSTSKKLELVVDLTAGFTKAEVLQAIEYLEGYITENIWPPA